MRLVVSSIAAYVLAAFLPGIAIEDFWTAIVLAIVLAVLNAIVKPLLILLTLPITIVTLGLFLWVINAAIILLADKLIDGFEVDNFWYALLFGFLLSGLTSLMYVQKKEK